MRFDLKKKQLNRGRSHERAPLIARTVEALLLRMQLNSEWLTNCIAVSDRLYVYHAVFDLAKNQWTECDKFEMKFKDLIFDFKFVTSRFEISRKMGFEIWLNGWNIFTELFEIWQWYLIWDSSPMLTRTLFRIQVLKVFLQKKTKTLKVQILDFYVFFRKSLEIQILDSVSRKLLPFSPTSCVYSYAIVCVWL